MTSPRATKASATTPAGPPAVSHIVKSHAPEKVILKDLSGTYRMIHGSIGPLPGTGAYASIHVIRRDADGEPLEYRGDEVFLSHDDAARMLEQNMIEPLDAKPSMCGKMWNRPQPGRVWVPPQPKSADARA